MRTTKACPKCRDTLPIDATSCECGWVVRTEAKAKPEREFVHCAFEACNEGAICRVKTAQGWANFCETHYGDYHAKLASSGLRQRGLQCRDGETPVEYRKRLMGWMRQHARIKSFDDAATAEDEWSSDRNAA